MRLTEKRKEAKYGYKYLGGTDNFGEGCNKLGQLEDIEEELGIDLWLRHRVERSQVVFVKELNEIFDGYYCNTDGEYGVEIIYYTQDGQMIDKHYFYWKNYGKTWALTKEELL